MLICVSGSFPGSQVGGSGQFDGGVVGGEGVFSPGSVGGSGQFNGGVLRGPGSFASSQRQSQVNNFRGSSGFENSGKIGGIQQNLIPQPLVINDRQPSQFQDFNQNSNQKNTPTSFSENSFPVTGNAFPAPESSSSCSHGSHFQPSLPTYSNRPTRQNTYWWYPSNFHDNQFPQQRTIYFY